MSYVAYFEWSVGNNCYFINQIIIVYGRDGGGGKRSNEQ